MNVKDLFKYISIILIIRLVFFRKMRVIIFCNCKYRVTKCPQPLRSLDQLRIQHTHCPTNLHILSKNLIWLHNIIQMGVKFEF